MRPQYRTANQLKSERPPMIFIAVDVSCIRVQRQGRHRQPRLEEHRVCAGDTEEGHFRPPDGAGQVQVRLHDQEQRTR